MSVLFVLRKGKLIEVNYEGTPLLTDVLLLHGFALQHPCGGRGVCRKCAVRVAEIDPADARSPEAFEKETEGAWHEELACQYRLNGQTVCVRLPEEQAYAVETEGARQTDGQMESPQAAAEKDVSCDAKVGAAIDIGTTTVVVRLVDMNTGRDLATRAVLNPQTQIASDVMGRIGAAMNGKGTVLQDLILQAISSMIADVTECAAPQQLVVAGNTTMLYLLTGRDPKSLSKAPFHADTLFDTTVQLPIGDQVYLPPCMDAFVGADISCAVLASGMCDHDETAMLIDVGTNGEIALWHQGHLYVSSTAAGPAFEGACISSGVGSIPGAIDKVWLEGDAVKVHTLGGQEATGVCGSGLVDAIAVFLENEMIDETGATDEDELMLSNGISIVPKDIRSVQLAKGAIAAGIQTILHTAKLSERDVKRLYIAGGFGSHLDTKNAARIGLFPASWTDRVTVLGNASLSGARLLLVDPGQLERVRQIAAMSEHVELGGNPYFADKYMDCMMFD